MVPHPDALTGNDHSVCLACRWIFFTSSAAILASEVPSERNARSLTGRSRRFVIFDA